jgi:hypothetical protein
VKTRPHPEEQAKPASRRIKSHEGAISKHEGAKSQQRN